MLPQGGPSGVRLAALSAIDAFGSGMFLAGSAVYFTKVVGLHAAAVGLGLSVAGVLGFLATVPIGMLADRWGAGPVCVVMNLWRAGCYIAYCFCDRFTTFLRISRRCCGHGWLGSAMRPVLPMGAARRASSWYARIEMVPSMPDFD